MKEEKVGYLKSKANLLQGTLKLTDDRLILEAHKTGVGGMGLLGSILKRKVEKENYGFDVALNEIEGVNQGKQGLQKNILEVKTKEGEYRIVVKSYDEWANLLSQSS